MTAATYELSDIADGYVDEIFRYSRQTWGDEQARRYVSGLYDCFAAIANRHVPWRTIDADLGNGYVCRYERHRVYWRAIDDRRVVILAVLHESMHESGRLRHAIEGS